MDMAAYKEKKQKNTVLLQRFTKDLFQLVAHRYDPDTGVESAPEIAQTNVEAINKHIIDTDVNIEQLQKRKEGLQALKDDMEAMEAAATSAKSGQPA